MSATPSINPATSSLAPQPRASRGAGTWAVLLLVVSFAIFSWGIWKARVGFGDDTIPVLTALEAAEAHAYPRNLYVLAYTLLLRSVAPDPIHAALIMRTIVSLGTTLALYYVLSAFRPHLQRMAIVMACAVWMVSHLNAPLVQYSNLSPFTFSIAALGLGWLLRHRSWSGLLGFLIAMACAISLRPEYFAPALLIGGVSGIALLWQTLKLRMGAGPFWGLLALGVLAAAAIVVPRFQGAGGMDRYLLFGLGQCYATFYKAEHPDANFHPMTEYQELLDTTFGHPTSFFGAVANNPREAFRYFGLNSLQNLKQLPPTLLSTRQTMVPTGLAGRWHAVLLLAVLLAGGALLAWRTLKMLRDLAGNSWKEKLRCFVQTHGALLRQVTLLALFCSASSGAIILLVASPRYWITCVPLLFLAVAACFDALLRLDFLRHRQWLLWVPMLALFCRPLFLHLEPNENFEVTALRQIAPRLPEKPVIAGVYTRPYQAYAFRGHAISVNAGTDLEAAGVREGRYDVLIVDEAMRTSKVWNENRDFFSAFVRDPALSGYVKLTEADTGRRDIYYRVRSTTKP